MEISPLDEVDIWKFYTYNNSLQLDRMDCLKYNLCGIYG
jgi:hypothetical protein